MVFIVATNVVANRTPELRLTGTPQASANLKSGHFRTLIHILRCIMYHYSYFTLLSASIKLTRVLQTLSSIQGKVFVHYQQKPLL